MSKIILPEIAFFLLFFQTACKILSISWSGKYLGSRWTVDLLCPPQLQSCYSSFTPIISRVGAISSMLFCKQRARPSLLCSLFLLVMFTSKTVWTAGDWKCRPMEEKQDYTQSMAPTLSAARRTNPHYTTRHGGLYHWAQLVHDAWCASPTGREVSELEVGRVKRCQV